MFLNAADMDAEGVSGREQPSSCGMLNNTAGDSIVLEMCRSALMEIF